MMSFLKKSLQTVKTFWQCWLIETGVYKNLKSFLNSTFLQTIAVIIVGFLAWSVVIKQNDLTLQLTYLAYSPAYNEVLQLSTFESDLKVENTGRVSLHSLQPQFS